MLAGEFAELNGDKYVAACKGMDEETLFESELLPPEGRTGGLRSAQEHCCPQARSGKYRIDYDVWFHESTLHESGAVKAVVDKLLELAHAIKRRTVPSCTAAPSTLPSTAR